MIKKGQVSQESNLNGELESHGKAERGYVPGTNVIISVSNSRHLLLTCCIIFYVFSHLSTTFLKRITILRAGRPILKFVKGGSYI